MWLSSSFFWETTFPAKAYQHSQRANLDQERFPKGTDRRNLDFFSHSYVISQKQSRNQRKKYRAMFLNWNEVHMSNFSYFWPNQKKQPKMLVDILAQSPSINQTTNSSIMFNTHLNSLICHQSIIFNFFTAINDQLSKISNKLSHNNYGLHIHDKWFLSTLSTLK